MAGHQPQVYYPHLAWFAALNICTHVHYSCTHVYPTNGFALTLYYQRVYVKICPKIVVSVYAVRTYVNI